MQLAMKWLEGQSIGDLKNSPCVMWLEKSLYGVDQRKLGGTSGREAALEAGSWY